MSVVSELSGIKDSILMSLTVFGIVFIITGLIMLCMMLLHKACRENVQTKPMAADEQKICEADTQEEITAVITAAILQFASENARIVSFKPSIVSEPKKTMWSRFGRIQNFENGVRR